jgi:hypothetical protein
MYACSCVGYSDWINFGASNGVRDLMLCVIGIYAWLCECMYGAMRSG